MTVLDSTGQSMSNATTDVDKLRFSPQMMIAMVAMVASTIGGVWASTYTMRSDIRDIKTSMQYEAKLTDERTANMRETIDTLKRQQTVLSFEMQALKEEVIKLKR